jgi:hypothetical protein
MLLFSSYRADVSFLYRAVDQCHQLLYLLSLSTRYKQMRAIRLREGKKVDILFFVRLFFFKITGESEEETFFGGV